MGIAGVLIFWSAWNGVSPAAEHPCPSWNANFELSVNFGVWKWVLGVSKCENTVPFRKEIHLYDSYLLREYWNLSFNF